MSARPEPLFAGREMVAGYGARPILNGCSIEVGTGEIVVVGPNGAGKSTAMKALLGLLPIASGTVTLAGEDIGALAPQRRVDRGIAFVPQNANVFPSLAVDENLEMGAYLRDDDIGETLAEVRALFPILAEERRQPAGQLSGGQRQQVAILATLAGELYGLDKSFKPFTHFRRLLPMFAAAVVGGIGKPVGEPCSAASSSRSARSRWPTRGRSSSATRCRTRSPRTVPPRG